jgi:hypothetical protein
MEIKMLHIYHSSTQQQENLGIEIEKTTQSRKHKLLLFKMLM